MKSRSGVSFVPSDHDADNSRFYIITSPISPPNGAVEGAGRVQDPTTFGAESPRTAEQCRHVDGSTMVNMRYPNKPSGILWLVWEVPPGAISIGRALMCHPRTSNNIFGALSFTSGDVRIHYAVPDGKQGWNVVEDAHQMEPEHYQQECALLVAEMDETDVKAAKEGGMWFAVESSTEAVLNFDYLVAM